MERWLSTLAALWDHLGKPFRKIPMYASLSRDSYLIGLRHGLGLGSLKSSPGKVVKLETNRGYCPHPSTELDDERGGGEILTKMNQVSYSPSGLSLCLRRRRKLKVDQGDSPGGPAVKNLPTNVTDMVLIPKIAWTEEPGVLQFMGSQRVGHDLATEHACAH